MQQKKESLGNRSWNNFSKNVPERSCWEIGNGTTLHLHGNVRTNVVPRKLFCRRHRGRSNFFVLGNRSSSTPERFPQLEQFLDFLRTDVPETQFGIVLEIVPELGFSQFPKPSNIYLFTTLQSLG